MEQAGSLLPSVPFIPATVGKETKRVWFHCGGSKRRYGCDVCASIEQGDDASTPAAQNKRQEGLENLKDGQEWYFWDTVSNETSWNRPAEINDEMFEKMKSEYQAPADGKAMPSSPPQSPQPATNDDVLEEVDSSDLSSERHKTLAKKLSSIASKHSMRKSYSKIVAHMQKMQKVEFLETTTVSMA